MCQVLVQPLPHTEYVNFAAMPQTPLCGVGVISLHGGGISAFDLRINSGMDDAGPTDEPHVLVVDTRQDARAFGTDSFPGKKQGGQVKIFLDID